MAGWWDTWVWKIRDLKGPKRSIQLLETAREHSDRDLLLDLTHVREVYPNGAVPFASVLAHLRAHTAEIRTRLDNYLKAGAQYVVLDFKGVGVVSSSFADEVLAKLAAAMGELEFRRRVFVDNASLTNRGLIERAIALRLEAAGVGGNRV